MASYGDDATLMKVAIFGVTISLMCTLGISVLLVETGDYDYDDIQAYRNDLIAFSGESMVNDSPWVLTHAYGPWNSNYPDDNVDADGWLYGEDYTETYEYIGESADIKLNPGYKSTVPLTYSTEVTSFDVQDGTQWWANIPVIGWIGTSLGFDPYTYSTHTSNNWNFTGMRYVFDPTLPFKSNLDDEGNPKTSTVDGSLSIVWYTYGGQEGLSGGLDIYGGSILVGHYSATDIVADYNTGSGYATTYDFDFNGANLNLSIRFDKDVIDAGTNLMQPWTEGSWSMAISSVSAGNFLDIENSAAYSNSVGSMIDTFIKIFTFNVPDLGNEWAGMILWLMCGLPMTIAMLCVTLRVISATKPSWL